jgi:hypothetical protein
VCFVCVSAGGGGGGGGDGSANLFRSFHTLLGKGKIAGLGERGELFRDRGVKVGVEKGLLKCTVSACFFENTY